jgi:hypothetical protein
MMQMTKKKESKEGLNELFEQALNTLQQTR